MNPIRTAERLHLVMLGLIGAVFGLFAVLFFFPVVAYLKGVTIDLGAVLYVLALIGASGGMLVLVAMLHSAAHRFNWGMPWDLK